MDLRTALLIAHHDGVCGCPELWGNFTSHKPEAIASSSFSHVHKQLRDAEGVPLPVSYPYQHHSAVTPTLTARTRNIATTIQPQTLTPTTHTLTPSHSHSPSVSPSPLTCPPSSTAALTNPNTPKETCFFWYHGDCRLGSRCDRQHKTRITWPIGIPPGFVHWQDCSLPLCPLRKDLVELAEARKKEREKEEERGVMNKVDEEVELGKYGNMGISDGAGIGRVHRIERRGDTHAAWQSSSSTLGSSSDSDSAFSDSSSDSNSEDVASQAKSLTQGPIEIIAISSDSSSSWSSSVSSSDSTTLAPSSSPFVPHEPSENEDGIEEDEVEVEPITSISHPGTIVNRKRRNTQSRPSQMPPNKRLRLNQPTKRPGKVSKYTLPPKPTQPQQAKRDSNHQTVVIHQPTPARQPPLDPRTNPQTLGICFHWYHKGICRPRQSRHTHRRIVCRFVHSLNTWVQWVSRPPNIGDHDPKCPLSLCPFREVDEAMVTATAVGSKFKLGVGGEHDSRSEKRMHARMHRPNAMAPQQKDRKAGAKARGRCVGEGRGVSRISLVGKHGLQHAAWFSKGSLKLDASEVQQGKRKKGVLVAYELPSGKDRADWVSAPCRLGCKDSTNSIQDTDALRRAFGEIE